MSIFQDKKSIPNQTVPEIGLMGAVIVLFLMIFSVWSSVQDSAPPKSSVAYFFNNYTIQLYEILSIFISALFLLFTRLRLYKQNKVSKTFQSFIFFLTVLTWTLPVIVWYIGLWIRTIH